MTRTCDVFSSSKIQAPSSKLQVRSSKFEVRRDQGGTMKTIASVITAAAIFGGGASFVLAQAHAHVIQQPSEAAWGPAPPVIPAGAQIAVLSGDPGKPVPYAVRLKFP